MSWVGWMWWFGCWKILWSAEHATNPHHHTLPTTKLWWKPLRTFANRLSTANWRARYLLSVWSLCMVAVPWSSTNQRVSVWISCVVSAPRFPFFLVVSCWTRLALICAFHVCHPSNQVCPRLWSPKLSSYLTSNQHISGGHLLGLNSQRGTLSRPFGNMPLAHHLLLVSAGFSFVPTCRHSIQLYLVDLRNTIPPNFS